MIEIYMEVVRDLLDTTKTNLRIREAPTGVYIEGLTPAWVCAISHAFDIRCDGDVRAIC